MGHSANILGLRVGFTFKWKFFFVSSHYINYFYDFSIYLNIVKNYLYYLVKYKYKFFFRQFTIFFANIKFKIDVSNQPCVNISIYDGFYFRFLKKFFATIGFYGATQSRIKKKIKRLTFSMDRKRDNHIKYFRHLLWWYNKPRIERLHFLVMKKLILKQLTRLIFSDFSSFKNFIFKRFFLSYPTQLGLRYLVFGSKFGSFLQLLLRPKIRKYFLILVKYLNLNNYFYYVSYNKNMNKQKNLFQIIKKFKFLKNSVCKDVVTMSDKAVSFKLFIHLFANYSYNNFLFFFKGPSLFKILNYYYYYQNFALLNVNYFDFLSKDVLLNVLYSNNFFYSKGNFSNITNLLKNSKLYYLDIIKIVFLFERKKMIDFELRKIDQYKYNYSVFNFNSEKYYDYLIKLRLRIMTKLYNKRQNLFKFFYKRYLLHSHLFFYKHLLNFSFFYRFKMRRSRKNILQYKNILKLLKNKYFGKDCKTVVNGLEKNVSLFNFSSEEKNYNIFFSKLCSNFKFLRKKNIYIFKIRNFFNDKKNKFGFNVKDSFNFVKMFFRLKFYQFFLRFFFKRKNNSLFFNRRYFFFLFYVFYIFRVKYFIKKDKKFRDKFSLLYSVFYRKTTKAFIFIKRRKKLLTRFFFVFMGFMISKFQIKNQFVYFKKLIKYVYLLLSRWIWYRILFRVVNQFFSFFYKKLAFFFKMKVKKFLQMKNYIIDNFLIEKLKISIFSLGSKVISFDLMILFFRWKLRRRFTLNQTIWPYMRYLKSFYKYFIKSFFFRGSGRFTRKQRADLVRYRFGKNAFSSYRVRLLYFFRPLITKYGTCGIKIWMNLNKRRLYRSRLCNKYSKSLHYFGFHNNYKRLSLI